MEKYTVMSHELTRKAYHVKERCTLAKSPTTAKKSEQSYYGSNHQCNPENDIDAIDNTITGASGQTIFDRLQQVGLPIFFQHSN